MDAQVFWNVIGRYNQDTIIIQIILLVLIVAILISTYTGKIMFGAKVILGITNLFIGIVFFGCYGTEPIQKYFALPLYISCGMIIEEGVDMELLEKIVISMKETADLAGISIVTGDTKVVEKGAVDQVFINTSGIGRVVNDFSIKEILLGDKIIVTGPIAKHGTTIKAFWGWDTPL